MSSMSTSPLLSNGPLYVEFVFLKFTIINPRLLRNSELLTFSPCNYLILSYLIFI
jgi:hypothetical protein